jgi:hypothetical protein
MAHARARALRARLVVGSLIQNGPATTAPLGYSSASLMRPFSRRKRDR